MKRIVSYFLLNGIFAYSIYAGFFRTEMINGFANIALFIGWVTAVSSFLFLSDEIIKSSKDLAEILTTSPILNWFNIAFDISVVAAFVWVDHPFLAKFYFLHILNIQTGRIKAKRFIDAQKYNKSGDDHE